MLPDVGLEFDGVSSGERPTRERDEAPCPVCLHNRCCFGAGFSVCGCVRVSDAETTENYDWRRTLIDKEMSNDYREHIRPERGCQELR
jgi:hypothetical protein